MKEVNVLMIAKALNGKIKVWAIKLDAGEVGYITSHGYYGGNLQQQQVDDTDKQAQARVNRKLRQGYTIVDAINNETIAHLPDSNTDIDGNLKPMKAQRFKFNKFKYPAIAQPKINGIRTFAIWGTYVEGEGMFSKEVEGAIFLSMSGLRYHVPHLSNLFTNDMFDDVDAYDGELYIPSFKLNQIRASIPTVLANGTLTNPSGSPLMLQFWCFDSIRDNVDQRERLWSALRGLNKASVPVMMPTMLTVMHKTVDKLVYVGKHQVNNDQEAIQFTDWCIEAGFEGSVIRDMEAEYAYGQRPRTMMKIKLNCEGMEVQDTECEVLDITWEFKNGRDVVKFICKNDINDSRFECMPEGTVFERLCYYEDRANIIGKMATVKFGERSGVKDVPLHANVVTIRDYE